MKIREDVREKEGEIREESPLPGRKWIELLSVISWNNP
jgi:hypothetical protein